MTAFATQSNIDMNGPGLLGSDVVGSSRRKSKRITIGTGLTLSGGILSNSLDLSGYVQQTSSTGSLILPSGTTAQRDVSPAAGYSRWNTTTSRFERWTGSIWENYVRLSGDTMTGALSLGSNGLTCGALTSSGNVIQDLASATTSDKQISLRLAGVEQTYYTHKYDAVVQGPALLLGGSIVVGAAAGSHGYVGRPDSVTALVLLNSQGIATASSQFIGWGSTNNPMRDPNSVWADLKLYRSAANAMAQRNGINAQCFLLNKSYTSDASQEALMLDAGKQISSKLGLYSYRGTSSGSNYPIQIGMLAADGTTFSGLSIATNGQITSGYTAMQDGFRVGSCMSTNWSSIYQVKLHPNTWIGWDSVGETGNSVDIQLNRKSVGKLAVRGDNGLCVRNLADSADAALTCGAITVSGIASVSASTTTRASINLPSGIAPASPANGDIWSDGSDIKVRLGGVTYTLTKV